MKDEKEAIVEFLLSQPYAKLSLDGKEIRMRCPHCGDSRTHLNETNFNIKIPDEYCSRFIYICFRASCMKTGYVTPEFLRMLGYNNFAANVYLNKINSKASKKKSFARREKRSIANFPNIVDKLNDAKLSYINNRLGIKLTYRDLIHLKINLDFKSLYRFNELDLPLKKRFFYEELSKSGIAFISAYNDFLIVRNTTNNPKLKRYTNVDIFENDLELDKMKFYTIPVTIDALTSEPVVLNMAEGTFDILSVYYNLDIDADYDNHIYVSVSGSSYIHTIEHLIRQYGLIDLVINIFSDKDVDIDKYEIIYNKVRRFTNSLVFKVYYNKLYKDFGVSKSKIDIEEFIISR